MQSYNGIVGSFSVLPKSSPEPVILNTTSSQCTGVPKMFLCEWKKFHLCVKGGVILVPGKKTPIRQEQVFKEKHRELGRGRWGRSNNVPPPHEQNYFFSWNDTLGYNPFD